MFNPFFNPYRVRRIDQGGIPTLDTIFSNVDTTNNTVTYGICPLEAPIITNTIDNSKEINDLKNDVADIRKMIEDTKKMFMGGFPKPPMPPMPNVPAPMK